MKTAVSLSFIAACAAATCLAQLAPAPQLSADGKIRPGRTNVFAPAAATLAAQHGGVSLAPFSSRTNLPAWTNSPGLPWFKMPEQPRLRSDKHRDPNGLMAQKQPAPGLYRSEPYTCLVLVPGPRPDDKAVVPAAPVAPRMPHATPEFRLVPHPPGRK